MGRKSNKRPSMMTHSFYCIQCGNKGIDLMRKQNFKHERFHRKKLYCPCCKVEINHVECQTEEDAYEFKINFEEGVYANEVEESLAVSRHSRIGKVDMGSESDRKESRCLVFSR